MKNKLLIIGIGLILSTSVLASQTTGRIIEWHSKAITFVTSDKVHNYIVENDDQSYDSINRCLYKNPVTITYTVIHGDRIHVKDVSC